MDLQRLQVRQCEVWGGALGTQLASHLDEALPVADLRESILGTA